VTDRLNVDVDHIRRCGVRIVEHGRDLSDLVDRLQSETATGPRWTGEDGGDTFAATYAEIAQAALGKLDLLVRDLDDIGTNLRLVAAELEAADERAEAAVRRVGRGL
jgi:uncharacterized protein YukE